MNYPAFTNDSLTMMYEGIRSVLGSDDALSRLGEQPRFGVRVMPDWKKHAGELETEMLKEGDGFLRDRGVSYRRPRLAKLKTMSLNKPSRGRRWLSRAGDETVFHASRSRPETDGPYEGSGIRRRDAP